MNNNCNHQNEPGNFCNRCGIALLMFLIVSCSDVPKEKTINEQLDYFQKNKIYFLEKSERETKKIFVRSEPQTIPELGVQIVLLEREKGGLLFSAFVAADAKIKLGDEVELYNFIQRLNKYQYGQMFLVARSKRSELLK
ncbi:MAG: hypothetical protein WC120_00275 [Parcubacteria group bacterium]